MSKGINDGLPPGWQIGGAECVAFKYLEDFRYAEIRYEPEQAYHGHDYALYAVNRDGPREETKQGVYEDLGKALSAAKNL